MKRAAPLLLLALAGCDGIQSAEGRDGVQSALIGNLFDAFLWVTGTVYLFVIVLLALAIVRGRRHRAINAGWQGEVPPKVESAWRVGLIAFVGATGLILAGLTIATWLTDRALASAAKAAPLEITVIGHQWWWEVRYESPNPNEELRTANELHLPVGRTAHISLQSPDVIHSLWIPNLAGKQDLIPGRDTDLTVHPNHLGKYRAECAEYCGLQHAHMVLPVTVETGAQFSAWYKAGLKPPPVPTGGQAFAGYTLFTTRQCASCHNVAGTPAFGQVAPDLSHVASRPTVAGTLPMSASNLAQWIADPQAVKPGNNMPKVPLSSAELAAVTAYLETLK
jgi:cytochrome c oxidase subunit 2